jgi:GAF domain-containing protein
MQNMIKPQRPPDEAARLAALLRYEVLDTESEEAFDDLVKIASGLCGVATATVSAHRFGPAMVQGAHNLELTQTSRDESFCGHAILDPDNVMMVPDATLDERFHDNPLVTAEGGIRFYAGAPLKSSDGHAVGTLCVFGGEANAAGSAAPGRAEGAVAAGVAAAGVAPGQQRTEPAAARSPVVRTAVA